MEEMQYDDLSASTDALEPVALSEDGSSVRIVDQTLLPGTFQILGLRDRQDMWDAIQQLKVRGAPAIGVAAAYCYYVLARQAVDEAVAASEAVAAGEAGATGEVTSGVVDAVQLAHMDDAAQPTNATHLRAALAENARLLASSRPTAVNLPWALARMEAVADAWDGDSTQTLLDALEAEARAVHQESVDAANEIARLGASLLEDGWGVLTHCNAGPLAATGLGTGQGPLYYAHQEGKQLHVFVDETRPLLQGARLTAFELMRAGIDATLICDNMAASLMRAGRIQAVVVGCDRIAANGDVANKVGTAGVAVLAAHYGVPFYVLGPTSTVDFSCACGDDIPIEERDGEEITTRYYAEQIAPQGVACYNPAFDVTDATLISAIITERGICRPPFNKSLEQLRQES